MTCKILEDITKEGDHKIITACSTEDEARHLEKLLKGDLSDSAWQVEKSNTLVITKSMFGTDRRKIKKKVRKAAKDSSGWPHRPPCWGDADCERMRSK